MTNYRRTYRKGGYYFFTLVTYDRRKFLCQPLARKILHEVFENVRSKWHFEIIAMVLMPEHLHCLWKLPEEDLDFSTRWRLIKTKFTKQYINAGGLELPQSQSRLGKKERGIWQRRF